jgi:hypothetical protein
MRCEVTVQAKLIIRGDNLADIEKAAKNWEGETSGIGDGCSLVWAEPHQIKQIIRLPEEAEDATGN